MSQRYAPGVRVEIRDVEWRIRCIDHTSDGGELLTCEGLSELVRGSCLANLTTNPTTGEITASQKDLDCEEHIDPSPYIIPTETNIVLGWNDIQHLQPGDTISKTYTGTTQASDPVERTIIYEAPFFKPNREEDYATAWVFFEGEK